MNTLRQWLAYLLGFAVFLGFFPWLIFLFAHYFPAPISQSHSLQAIIATLFLISGLVFMLLANLQMKKQGKGNPVDGFNIALGERTQHLMISGVYRFCRNPMLLGTFLFYLGIALFLNTWAGLIIPLAFILFMVWYVQKFEEPRLERDFGEPYRQYQKNVPLLFPRFLFSKK